MDKYASREPVLHTEWICFVCGAVSASGQTCSDREHVPFGCWEKVTYVEAAVGTESLEAGACE